METYGVCWGSDTDSCGNLGYMYEEGRGIGRDYARALARYRRSCNDGSALRCNDLGVMYFMGKGVTKDEKEARALFQKACDTGNSMAYTNLLTMEHRLIHR